MLSRCGPILISFWIYEIAYIVIFQDQGMNSSDVQNKTFAEPGDPWKESGAMVYVALTVATFSMIVMCCTWLLKQRAKQSKYSSVGHEEEEIELTSAVSSEDEEIPLTMATPEHAASIFECEETASVDENEREEAEDVVEDTPEPDPSVFSMEDDEDEHDADKMTTV